MIKAISNDETTSMFLETKRNKKEPEEGPS